MNPVVEKIEGWTIFPLPVRFNGECLADYAPAFESLLAEDTPAKILFDFSTVRYLDSTGIGALIHLYGDVRKSGGILVCSNCRPAVIQIFKLVNLQRYIKTYETREEAMKHGEEKKTCGS